MIKKSSKIVALASVLGVFAFGAALHNNIITLPIQVVSDPVFAADFSNDQMLMGASHNVFVGKVLAQVGTKERGIGPESQFSVEVISNIKGNLSGTVVVNQEGGYKNGILVLAESGSVGNQGDPLLVPGKTYLFASRYSAEQNWYTLISHANARKIMSSDKSITHEQLRLLAEKDSRVKQLQEAYKNEILLDVDVATNNTKNSYVSTHPVTSPKSTLTPTSKTK